MRCILSRGPRRRRRFAAVQEKLQSLKHFSSPAQATPAGKLFFFLQRGLEQISKTGNASFSAAYGGRFCLGLALQEDLFQLGSNFVRHSTSLAHGKKMHFSSFHVGKAGASAEKHLKSRFVLGELCEAVFWPGDYPSVGSGHGRRIDIKLRFCFFLFFSDESCVSPLKKLWCKTIFDLK